MCVWFFFVCYNTRPIEKIASSNILQLINQILNCHPLNNKSLYDYSVFMVWWQYWFCYNRYITETAIVHNIIHQGEKGCVWWCKNFSSTTMGAIYCEFPIFRAFLIWEVEYNFSKQIYSYCDLLNYRWQIDQSCVTT